MAFKKKKLLKILGDEIARPLSLKELMKHLGAKREDRNTLKRIMETMISDGDVVKIRGGRYGIPSKMNLVVGKLQGHPDGYGFVIPDEGGEDVFVTARNVKEAMHGDHVVVRVEGCKPGGKRDGRIIRVVERAHRLLVGRFDKGKNFGYVVPAEARISQDIYIPKGCDGGAKDGDVVNVEITDYPTGKRNPEGRIVLTLGRPDDPEVEIKTILLKHEIADVFPDEVLAEAEGSPELVRHEDKADRRDLTGQLTVTIDGETARDFDDAISVLKESDGRIRLFVSIADVSHYVKEGSPLDVEAYSRGTSVYFPDRCNPMLPEKLSNGICSLNPEVERLTMTAEMLFDTTGNCVESSFYSSVIRSDFRMTYTEVKGILVDSDAELKKKYANVLPDLSCLEELYGRLNSVREARGCINFDLPEAQLIIDIQGGVEAIVRSERNVAHMIIEECMLAANEAVAAFLTKRGYPLLYRIHERPNDEKIFDFKEFIHNFGYTLRGESPEPKEFQRLLKMLSGKPEERTINHVMLRAMKQAVYSNKNIGHFGLAAEEYCHFTSPIRRYPDLIIHRILKKSLREKKGMDQKGRDKLLAGLAVMGEETSARERRAMEAERDVVELKKVQFMRDKVGNEYMGFITGVTAFGLFVELEELFVEGLVHVTSLDDDYYHFDEKGHSLTGEKRKKCFRIGEEVRVRVDRVDVEKKRIDFALA